MSSCAIEGCVNYYKRTKGTNIKYFMFPKDKRFRVKWVAACKRQSDINLKNARICSIHFTEDAYELPLMYRLMENEKVPTHLRILKKDALPTLFLLESIEELQTGESEESGATEESEATEESGATEESEATEELGATEESGGMKRKRAEEENNCIRHEMLEKEVNMLKYENQQLLKRVKEVEHNLDKVQKKLHTLTKSLNHLLQQEQIEKFQNPK